MFHISYKHPNLTVFFMLIPTPIAIYSTTPKGSNKLVEELLTVFNKRHTFNISKWHFYWPDRPEYFNFVV